MFEDNIAEAISENKRKDKEVEINKQEINLGAKEIKLIKKQLKIIIIAGITILSILVLKFNTY